MKENSIQVNLVTNVSQNTQNHLPLTEEQKKNLGPLAFLAGIWEGDKGDDRAPSDDRGVENNKFREQMEFVPLNEVKNHEQSLFGLRYRTTAWVIGQSTPFHEEVGYWLWDAKNKQILRSFMVPRGVTVLAGGTVRDFKKSKGFKMQAKLGSKTYGILSNKFLDKEFKTTQYDLKVTLHSDGSFSYEEDTQIKIKGQKKIFHHRDKNTLRKISI